MKKNVTTILLAALVMLNASAAMVKNEFFTLTTPDDSWFLTNDDALRPYGARVDVARMDARGATLELARIDYIEGAFDPLLYLTHQVVEKKDVFCRAATNFTDIYESFMAGQVAQCVQFKKTSNHYTYDCEATAFNIGYGTVLVITAHRDGDPSMVTRVLNNLTFTVDTTPTTTAAQCVAAASKVVARHHLPIGNNEHLSGAELSKDSSTVTLKVTVPYITKENVNVPAFVMAKRDAWFKQAHESLKFNLLLATAAREHKNLRYHYIDTKGNEIGTLLIYPEEYAQVEKQQVAKSAEVETKNQEMSTPNAEANQLVEQAKPTEVKVQEQPIATPAKTEAESVKTNSLEKPQEVKTVTHVVKQGDNLTRIAKHYGVAVSAIKNANPSIKNDQIKIGQKLTIPRD